MKIYNSIGKSEEKYDPGDLVEMDDKFYILIKTKEGKYAFANLSTGLCGEQNNYTKTCHYANMFGARKVIAEISVNSYEGHPVNREIQGGI